MPSQELKDAIAEQAGLGVRMALQIGVLEAKLDLAMTHIRSLLTICERGGPEQVPPGHVCGPEGNCDMTCIGATYDGEAMLAAKKFLEMKK